MALQNDGSGGVIDGALSGDPDQPYIEGAGPNDGLIFEIDPNDTEIKPFAPEYYPDRFNKAISKELNRDTKQCKGEDISIKEMKNAELHATGVMLASQSRRFQELSKHKGTVDLITPISPRGGIQCYIKKAELGEIEGYDPKNDEWEINYTIDFVGTGNDEYGDDTRSSIVTELLDR